MKRMDTSLKATHTQIEHLDAQIATENARMAAHTQAKHEETQRKLEEAREAVHTAESDLETIRKKKQEQHTQNEALKSEGVALDQEIKQLQTNIQQCEGMIERYKQAEKNSLIPYGKNIKELLEKVRTMKWVGDAPLGPLGVYVKAKDPKTWGDLLRNQLGSFLTAFAVTDARDRAPLKSLLQQSGK
jgi:structural maintenance of chromosomes protein 6